MVRSRSHFAIKFVAGTMRVFAVLVVLGGLAGAFTSVTQFQTLSGTFPVGGGLLSLLWIAFSLFYALFLWGFADGFILLADTYDAQRTTDARMNEVLAEVRQLSGGGAGGQLEGRGQV